VTVVGIASQVALNVTVPALVLKFLNLVAVILLNEVDVVD
jgi:hypothetical protein